MLPGHHGGMACGISGQINAWHSVALGLDQVDLSSRLLPDPI